MKRIGLLLAVVAGVTGTVAMGQTAAAGATVGAAGAGGGADGLTVWAKGVPPASAPRASFDGGFAMMISHRTASDQVEVHLTTADIMVVQSGTATLVTGGEVVDPVQKGPNEMGGTAIKGGVSRVLQVGDVVEIPPGVPHQYFIEPGGQITYLLVKVVKK
jgi:mannose-6-phosphate isomerase-like protein (cupin superfamily)